MQVNRRRTITICGSMKVIEEMTACADQLEYMGIGTYLPDLNEPIDYSMLSAHQRAETKSRLIRKHIEKIKVSDAVLIHNITIGDRVNYIGSNAFLEMGFAFAFGKPIYLFTEIPDQPNSDEIAGMLPICLHSELDSIR